MIFSFDKSTSLEGGQKKKPSLRRFSEFSPRRENIIT